MQIHAASIAGNSEKIESKRDGKFKAPSSILKTTKFQTTCSIKNTMSSSGKTHATTDTKKKQMKIIPAPVEKATTTTNKATEQMRATMAYTGLSELAKQLRILQSKNGYQASEIERLERQLRILAELNGISVSDLRSRLESACQQEAHSELLNRISSLQAQLETMKLKESSQNQSMTKMEQQSKSREMLHLELRVGELEEIDQTLRIEMQSLYKRLSEQTVKATSAECAKRELENQVSKYRVDVESNKESLDQVTKEKNQYRTEKDDLEKKIDQLQLKLKLSEDQNRSLTSQINLQSKISIEATMGGKVVDKGDNEKSSDKQQGDVLEQVYAILQKMDQKESSKSATSSKKNAAKKTKKVTRTKSDELSTTKKTIVKKTKKVGENKSAESSPVVKKATKVVGTKSADSSPVPKKNAVKKIKTTATITKAEKLQTEIISLYEKLRESESKATKLEAMNKQIKLGMAKLKKELEAEKENQTHLQKNYNWTVEEHNKLYEKFCDIELQLSIEKDNVLNLEEQIFAHQKDITLQKDQYNSRFTLQQEQILDMKQQMASLYTACNILGEDCEEQIDRRLSLNKRLGEADSSLARQLTDEVSGGQQNLGAPALSPTTTASSTTASSTTAAISASTTPTIENYYPDTATMVDNYSDTTTIATTTTTFDNIYSVSYPDTNYQQQQGTDGAIAPLSVSPIPETLNSSLPQNFVSSTAESTSTPHHQYYGNDHDYSAAHCNTYSPASTTQSQQFSNVSHCLVEGYMYKFDPSNSIFNAGWKKRYFKLSCTDTSAGQYQLAYSNNPIDRMKGFFPVTKGISSISETTDFHSMFPNQLAPSEYIIPLVIDSCGGGNGQQQQHPPVVFLATKTQESHYRWTHAINNAVEFKPTSVQQEESDHQMAIRLQMQMSGN